MINLNIMKKNLIGGCMLKEYSLQTSKRNEMKNITQMVYEAIEEAKFSKGYAIVYCPHTTAAITINEGADPDVQKDIINGLEKLAPPNAGYFHMEGNADSHIKSSLVGISEIVIIENGKPILGMWQKIFFCEFDGPRNRHFFVKVQNG